MGSNAGEMHKIFEGLQVSQNLRGKAESSSVAELLDLRTKGNQQFLHGDWKGAIECYSECIDFALKDVPVSCYSNRAEALLKLEEYGKAVEDCEKALQLHSTHLNSLFRKGRALYRLKEYDLACSCFRLALEQSPADKEIMPHYEKSKKLNEENQQGKFDLSSYFLNGCRLEDIPEVSNYIGPVIVKKSPVHGRGLFVTKNVEIGDTVLVENAIAVSGLYRSPVAFGREGNPASVLDGFIQETVEQAVACAVSCPRVSRQLEHLTKSCWIKETEVPDMELFTVNNGNWNKFGENPKNLPIDTFKLRKAMELNNLLTHVTQDEEKPVKEDEDDVNRKVRFWNRVSKTEQCGFWGLPSFINHSCFPNAKCMVVGKAMFIIAVREIVAGEEITISYFRNFVPLVERESHFIHLGFRCKCKRCVLEGSLGPSFEQQSHIICNYYNSLFHQTEPTNVSSKDMQSMVRFILQLENIDAQGEEKHLIRASFSCIYKFVFAAAMEYPDFGVLLGLLPTKLEVAESLRHADPSSLISLELFQMLVDEAHGQQRDLLLQKTMENGITVFGKQKENVLKALVESRFVVRFQTVRTRNADEIFVSITF